MVFGGILVVNIYTEGWNLYMSQIKCSFCGKASDDVLRIIAGPGVRICDECVILSMSILLDSPVFSGQVEVFTDEEVIRKTLKYDKKPSISWCKACRSFIFDLRSDKAPNVFVEHQCFKMLEGEKKTTHTLNGGIPKVDKS